MNLPAWVGIVVLVISILINLVGFFGLFLVFFPGLTVAWIGQLVWMLFTRFNQSAEPWQRGLTIGIFVVNTLIMLIGSWLDNVFMAGRAREKGAPWWEIGVSILAMIIGGILFTPIGGLALALGAVVHLDVVRPRGTARQFGGRRFPQGRNAGKIAQQAADRALCRKLLRGKPAQNQPAHLVGIGV